jgi:ferrochelatase
MGKSPIGVLLMAFGGPENEAAVEGFLSALLGKERVSQGLLAQMKKRYRLIGGGSPLPAIVREQARALEKELAQKGGNWRVLAGMRYTSPSIGDALRLFQQEGVEKLIPVSLSPHFSRITTGAYLEEVHRVNREDGLSLEILPAPAWYDHPLFIQALARRVREGLAGFPPERRRSVRVIFTAHSLPESYIRDGDPYVGELEATVEALVRVLGSLHWHLAYQSKGRGEGNWLGPLAEEVLEQIRRAGCRDVLVVPVGFTAEHVETLYDLDHVLRNQALHWGLNFRRTEAPNTLPEFIQSLAAVIIQAIKSS